MLTITLALLAAASNACASVLQRKANLREVEADRSGIEGLVDLLRQPPWLAGIGAVILSFVFQAAALATGELSEVQPLMSLELPMTLLLASRMFHHRLSPRTWGGILAMSGGMGLFLFCLHPSQGAEATPDGWTWVLASGATAGLVVALALTAYLTRGPTRAALLGAASGVAFALTAAFMSGALAHGPSWELLTRWQTYLVVLAGLTALVLLQEALRAGPLVVVQPGVTLVDPVIAVLLGVLLFSESVRTGPWVIGEVLGAAAVGWGAIRLSASPLVGAGDDARDGGPSELVPERADSDTVDGT